MRRPRMERVSPGLYRCWRLANPDQTPFGIYDTESGRAFVGEIVKVHRLWLVIAPDGAATFADTLGWADRYLGDYVLGGMYRHMGWNAGCDVEPPKGGRGPTGLRIAIQP